LGEQFGRPHYHFLIYNAHKHFYPIGERKRSNRLHIGLWPHGHIDSGNVTRASIRYVSGYIMKQSEIPPITYRTSRPGIGFYGASKLGALTARKHGWLPRPPDYLMVGGRKYPMDRFTRKAFLSSFCDRGYFDEIPSTRDIWLQKLFETQTTDSEMAQIEKIHRKIETEKAIADGKKENREKRASAALLRNIKVGAIESDCHAPYEVQV
jgi:hypothetical protein